MRRDLHFVYLKWLGCVNLLISWLLHVLHHIAHRRVQAVVCCCIGCEVDPKSPLCLQAWLRASTQSLPTTIGIIANTKNINSLGIHANTDDG
jgi:hypothetical protein